MGFALYSDMGFAALSEAARKTLNAMDLENYEWQSDFAKKHVQIGIDQGLKNGMELGLEKGLEKGERRILEGLLKNKFGSLSAHATEKLDQAGEVEFSRWSINLLTATSLDEVFD